VSDPGTTAELYRRWAQVEASGSSAVYERLARAVAQAADVLELLQQVPEGKRQPNLLFGALRWCDAPVQDPPAALGWLRALAAGAVGDVRPTNSDQRGRALRDVAAHSGAVARTGGVSPGKTAD